MFRSDLLAKHSGYSKENCRTCGQAVTNASLSYSLRFYGKPLCRTCQSLEQYADKEEEKIDPEDRGVPSLLD